MGLMLKTIIGIATCWSMVASLALASQAAGIDHAGLARHVIERHIRPQVHAFAEMAADLPVAIERLCAEPSAARLEAAHDRFSAAALAFARLPPLRFGPLHEKSRAERLLLYPDPKGLVRRQVEKALSAADPTLLSAETLYGKSVALQGFSALELLLFVDAAERTMASDDHGRLRCGYARAIAANVARIATDIDRAWQDPNGYTALMLAPGADNPAYLEPKEVTLEVIKSFLDGIEQARDLELAAPIGMRVLGQAPTTALLERSGLSLPYLTAGLEGLLHLYREGGLQTLAASGDTLLAAEVSGEIESAIRSAKTVTGTLTEARDAPGEKQKLVAMGFPLRNAADLARDTLAAATGLSLGFKAGDGD